MRHAKSSWADESLSDFDRPLNKRGRRSTPVMAQRLRTHYVEPDVLISSSSQRTRETADLLIENGLLKPEQCTFIDDLYHASASTIQDVVQDQDANCVMILAHNPGVTYFVNHFSNAMLDNLPTAGIAVIDFEIDFWTELEPNKTGKLHVLEFPRMFE